MRSGGLWPWEDIVRCSLCRRCAGCPGLYLPSRHFMDVDKKCMSPGYRTAHTTNTPHHHPAHRILIIYFMDKTSKLIYIYIYIYINIYIYIHIYIHINIYIL